MSVAKDPKQLGELLLAAIQAGDAKKIAALVPPKDVAEKVIEAIPFPDEATKRKQAPLALKHFAELTPKFGEMLKQAKAFADANKFDWKDARVVEVEAKTKVGREGWESFSKMQLRIAIGDEESPSLTLEMDDGAKLGDAWYFTDAPLLIELERDGKTIRQHFKKTGK
jgi:hypothetical protein